MTITWFLRYRGLQTKFFVISDHFLPFYFNPFTPSINKSKSENQMFEKMNKKTGDIIFLQKCTINNNYIMYGSSDMENDGQNFLWFWTIFYPFTPLTTPKIKILEKWKKNPRNIIILQMCTLNDNHMIYGSWDMEC